MGELGTIRTYHYWSDRKIKAIATDNNIDLKQRVGFTAIASIPGVGQLGLSKDTRELHRHEIATRLETAIGMQAVEDFVTPPPAHFAKGVGHVEFARDQLGEPPEMGAIMHVQAKSSIGQQVHVCLFGSPDNFSSYLQSADFNKRGWTSSSWPAIQQLILSQGSEFTWHLGRNNGDEQLAVEALRVTLHQGITGHLETHEGKPWTRGYTVGYSHQAEWMAQIYKDVELTRRWIDAPGVDRILIGAPLWIRTPSSEPVKLYHGVRK